MTIKKMKLTFKHIIPKGQFGMEEYRKILDYQVVEGEIDFNNRLIISYENEKIIAYYPFEAIKSVEIILE